MEKFRKTAIAKVGSWLMALSMVVTGVIVPDAAALAYEAEETTFTNEAKEAKEVSINGITVEPESVTVPVGEEATVTVTVTVSGDELTEEQQAVSANSSDPSKVEVVSVSDNKVTVRGVEGTGDTPVTVTVTSEVDKSKTAEFSVTVRDNSTEETVKYFLVGPILGTGDAVWNTTDYEFAKCDGEDNLYEVTVENVEAGPHDYHVLMGKKNGDDWAVDWNMKFHDGTGFAADQGGNRSYTVNKKANLKFVLSVSDNSLYIEETPVDEEDTTVSLNSITVTPASVNIAEGATQKLTVSYIPANVNDSEKGVTYKSADETVATVAADGTVKGVKAGTTKITVTSTKKSGVKAEVNVTVTKAAASDKDNGKKETPQAVGKTLKSATGSFKVTKSASGAAEVEFTAPASKTAKSVTIPDAITDENGVTYKVTSVAANAFKGMKKLTTVKLGKNVTTIGKSAFSGCTKLKTVKLDEALTNIGSSAFSGCTALKSVTIPKNVTTIGGKAFNKCKNLKKITIKSTVLKKVGSGAFKGLKKGATIKVPKKLKKNAKKILKAPKTVKIK